MPGSLRKRPEPGSTPGSSASFSGGTPRVGATPGLTSGREMAPWGVACGTSRD